MGQPACFLFFCCVGLNVTDDNTLDTKSPAVVTAASLLVGRNGIKSDAASSATVSLWDRGAENAGRTGLVPEIAFHYLFFVPSFDVGYQMVREETTDAVSIQPVIVVEPGGSRCGKRHGVSVPVVQ